ncbi:DNA-packaging protein [Stakelama saccharophila]|uniref:Terminase family protein n=1 Tax=Stakelama saccharophila TaxID=3075605 RepID=A0ABZ0B8K2_9SPHN|nr:terminase family protein [Stakelama sp. W311]WNO53552.1 terminase family protein [Stakelama sp. W311]
MTESDVIERLLACSAEERRHVLRGLTPPQRRELNGRWSEWAHPGQLAPQGKWRIWMIVAGRGFGKTRAGAEWVSAFARDRPHARIALVGSSVDDVRRVMIDGESGLLAVAQAEEAVAWNATRGEVRFDSGARAYVYSAAAPERLRGPEHHAAWCDELAKWGPGAEIAWDNLMMGLRLGDDPRAVVTTTPRPVPLMRRIAKLPGAAVTRGRTRDNPHLPDTFVEAMVAQYGGTRIGRQELDGELIEDVAGALWTRALLEAARVRERPAVRRVVVGVDSPAGSDGDACGIVAVALGRDGLGYVLEDASVAATSPEGWARAVAACAVRTGADRVVAEANNGGAMVRSVLLAADTDLPLKLVHASRGKSARAEPVAALYEAGRAFHVGAFPALEDELCGLIAGGGYEGPGRSPDRADALVWAMSEVMLKRRGAVGVRVM